MPTSWTLRLHLPTSSPRPVTPGQLHGLACALTEHPESEHLAQTKPFSISPLFQDGSDSDYRILRLGWLDDRATPDLGRLRGRRVRLGNNFPTITDIRSEHVGYADLLDGPPANRAEFAFHSATYFKRGGQWIPLPEPRLVFLGLIRRWNAFAPEPISHEVGTALIESVVVTEHDMHTVPVDLSRGSRIGFLGSAAFTVVKPPADLPGGVFPAVCRFAGTAGVGAQTTHGLGHVQIRLQPRPHLSAGQRDEARRR